MVKPDRCPMQVKCCEECRHWEPVPFHDKGGFCSLKGGMPAHWQLVEHMWLVEHTSQSKRKLVKVQYIGKKRSTYVYLGFGDKG